MLLKNAANKVTKLFGKLSPESQLRLHNADTWDEYRRYANMEMNLRERLLDADAEAMRFLKEHPDDYRAGLVRMLGKDDDLGYLLAHGVTPEELAANPYFRVSDNVYSAEHAGDGAVTGLPDAVDRKMGVDDGVVPEKERRSILDILGLKKKPAPVERMLVQTGDPFVRGFDSALEELKGNPELVRTLLAFGKDGRVDTVATHRNVLMEAARRAVPEAPVGRFLNVSSDKVVRDKFGRATGAVRTDSDIDKLNVQLKRKRLEKLKELYLKEKSGNGPKEAYRKALEELESLDRERRESLLDDVAVNVFANNHESSEVKHGLRRVMDSGTFRPEGTMFRRIFKKGVPRPCYEISGNHYGIGVLADELADSNHPAFWRARNDMYSAKPGDGKGRWETGEQMFLSNLMRLDDPFALGRAVKLPEGAYDRIRDAVPEVIPGDGMGSKGDYLGPLKGRVRLPKASYRLGYSMD